IAPGKQVVAYDQGGGAYAARMWWMLRWLGFEAAAVLDGGYAKWAAEGRVVSTEPTEPTPATFKIQRVTPTVGATGVMASIPRQGLLILDARAPERFRGEKEPFDPVAGHIPGAGNVPSTSLLAGDGSFLPDTDLAQLFDSQTTGVYCGSGVTASVVVAALAATGVDAALYPGSWSEWCSDPNRPVARG
ncbi:MAG TPA: rhodanese-like domain-containing protein, partial [Mycobacterium sp.]|nr:rhodanese-like domain-containing protein [Mycobacterium sp.]